MASGVSIGQEKVDPELNELVAAVAKSAQNTNLEALGRLMVEDFLYSFGISRDRTEAIEWYRRHPELMQKIPEVLAQPCAFTDVYQLRYYICPTAAINLRSSYVEYRAAFRQESSELIEQRKL